MKHLTAKSLVVSGLLAVGMSGASAQTYTYGEEAAASTVTAAPVTQAVTTVSVGNVQTAMDAVVGSITGGIAPISSSNAAAPKQALSFFDSGVQSENGVAAGQRGKIRSVWMNGAYTDVSSDLAGGEFDGDVYGVNIGVDTFITDNVLIGISGGYANTKVDTTFNNGELEEDTFTLSPYALFVLNDNFNVSAILGYSWSDIDQNRANGTITGSTEAETAFFATTLSGTTVIDNWVLTGRAGYLYAKRETDGFQEVGGNLVDAVESNTGQGRLGAEVGYNMGTLAPFVSVDYLRDFKDEINDDKDGYNVGGGMRYNSEDGAISVGVDVKTQVSRDDFDSTTLSGVVRYRF